MAKRYDQKTKDEVVAFIKEFNDENGRGGQAAAAKKYNLNPITIKSWLQKAGVKTPGKTGKKRKGGKKTRTVGAATASSGAATASRSASGSGAGTLERMIQIRNEISKLENEYESLKAKL